MHDSYKTIVILEYLETRGAGGVHEMIDHNESGLKIDSRGKGR